MKTTKPLTTISYNSKAFLIGTLNDLVKNGFLQFWAFIRHEPEEDEKKQHFHVWLEPAKRVDSQFLAGKFTEIVAGEELPRKCLPFHFNSSWSDWYWYGLHDKRYLASKGESRKYVYLPSEYFSSDSDYLDELVRTHPCPMSEMLRALELFNDGLAEIEVAKALNVPLARLMYWRKGYRALVGSKTYRGGREGHEPVFEAGYAPEQSEKPNIGGSMGECKYEGKQVPAFFDDDKE